MLLVDSNKRFLDGIRNKLSSKWRAFKKYTNKKTLALGKSYLDFKKSLTARYNSIEHKVRVKKYRFNTKLRDKWNNKWSNYVSYLLWVFTPYVLVYGLAVNFMASQFGLLSLTLGNIVASGLATYFVKEEFPEWMNGIQWIGKDQSSEV